MSEIVKCKRCNRLLTSKESIERGYGSTCYRIITLRESDPGRDPVVQTLAQPGKYDLDLNFLKCEIKFLKKQMKELKQKGITSTEINAIERIKQDEHRPERDQFKVQFNVVVKELKMVFKGDNFDYHSLLQPIEPRIEIEEPPIIEKTLVIN